MLISQAHARSADSLDLPFAFAEERASILVQVRINDKLALLILDTGSSHTIVRPEFLAIKPSALVPTEAAAGGGFKGDAVGREITLQVGSWKLEKQRVAVMDLSQVLSVYREKIDGILGLDFLFQFSRATINFNEKTIMLVR